MNKKRPFTDEREAFLYDLCIHRIALGAALLDATKLARSFSGSDGSIRTNPNYTELRGTLKGLREREEKNYATLIGLLNIPARREEQIRQAAVIGYVNGN